MDYPKDSQSISFLRKTLYYIELIIAINIHFTFYFKNDKVFFHSACASQPVDYKISLALLHD